MTAPVPARLGDDELDDALEWLERAADYIRHETGGPTQALAAVELELSRLRAAETRVRELTKSHAITAHAIGHTDYERKFLDILHVLGDQP